MEVGILRILLLFLTNLHLIKLSDEKVPWVDGFDRKFHSKSDVSLGKLKKDWTIFGLDKDIKKFCTRNVHKTSNE